VKSARAVVLARIGTLTPRERQVFELVILGKQNKQIAFALGCTERTIRSIMEKIQVQSLAELVSLAERVGVLGIANRQVPLYEDRTPPLL
jgi:FixJ family two-component response regulator